MDIVEAKGLSFVTTVRPDGLLSVHPVSVIAQAGTLRFSTMKDRGKVRNLRQDNRVSVCIPDPANPGSFISDPNFTPHSGGDAKVIFTSFFDDLATSVYIDPDTNIATTIVPRIDSDNTKDVDLVNAVPAPGYTGPQLQPRFPNQPATASRVEMDGGVPLRFGRETRR